MNIKCPECGVLLKEGDSIHAIVVSKFRQLASRTIYAIDSPTDCIAITHSDCFDRENEADLDG